MYGQTVDVTFSIDSVAPTAWYFTTTNTTTMTTNDQQISAFRRRFDNKDSTISYARRVLEAVQMDSITAERNLIAADSARHRIGRAIYGWDTSFSGARSLMAPPPAELWPDPVDYVPISKDAKKPAKKKAATKPKTRVKNANSNK